MVRPMQKYMISAEEYLELEDKCETRNEYVAGQVFAMAGTALAHNCIIGNLQLHIAPQVQLPCRFYFMDIKVRIETSDCYYYPDAIITCEPYNPTGKVVYTPSVIFEVLSASTELIDRREKRMNYALVAGLRYYILIHQDKQKVEIMSRERNEKWSGFAEEGSGEIALKLPNGSITLSMDKLYKDVFG